MVKHKHIVSISTGSLWRALLILLAMWFLYTIKSVLLMFFMSFVIVSAASPLVDKLQRKNINRVLTTFLLFIVLFVLVFYLIYLIVPLIATELKLLGQNFPAYMEEINKIFKNINQVTATYKFQIDLQKVGENFSDQLPNSFLNIFSNTLAFVGTLFNVLVVLSLSFYMMVRKDAIKHFLESITPSRHQAYIIDLTNRIQYKMGRWLIGQFALILVIFVLDYLALISLNVPYALLLALIDGLLEIIPYIGPTIAIIPAALVGLTISPWIGLMVLILYIFIQQLENYVLTPLIMKKAVGLNPVAVILALMIGGTLAGVIGVIIAVPAATAIGVFLSDLVNQNSEFEEGLEKFQNELI